VRRRLRRLPAPRAGARGSPCRGCRAATLRSAPPASDVVAAAAAPAAAAAAAAAPAAAALKPPKPPVLATPPKPPKPRPERPAPKPPKPPPPRPPKPPAAGFCSALPPSACSALPAAAGASAAGLLAAGCSTLASGCWQQAGAQAVSARCWMGARGWQARGCRAARAHLAEREAHASKAPSARGARQRHAGEGVGRRSSWCREADAAEGVGAGSRSGGSRSSCRVPPGRRRGGLRLCDRRGCLLRCSATPDLDDSALLDRVLVRGLPLSGVDRLGTNAQHMGVGVGVAGGGRGAGLFAGCCRCVRATAGAAATVPRGVPARHRSQGCAAPPSWVVGRGPSRAPPRHHPGRSRPLSSGRQLSAWPSAAARARRCSWLLLLRAPSLPTGLVLIDRSGAQQPAARSGGACACEGGGRGGGFRARPGRMCYVLWLSRSRMAAP
jgi:hypothetical protein